MTVIAPPRRALPHCATAAAVFGWVAGAVAWLITSQWTDATSTLLSFGRLDQLQMLSLGAVIGACVLAGRARHRRENVLMAALAGAMLGGAPALLAATVAWWIPIGTGPVAFVATRIVAWGICGAFVAGTLSMFSCHWDGKRIAESACIAAIGGATSGAIFSMPGPAELWLPVAMTFFGAAVGFAAVGPAAWRAPLLVQALPAREKRRNMLSLSERSVDNGWSINLSGARLGCVDGRVYMYPPPGGINVDGHAFYRAVELKHDALLTVGRVRYRAILSAWRA